LAEQLPTTVKGAAGDRSMAETDRAARALLERDHRCREA